MIKKFEFIQTTESLTWVVYHGFGVVSSFDIFIDKNGKKEKAYPLSVNHTSVNSITITWSTPRSGAVTVIGAV